MAYYRDISLGIEHAAEAIGGDGCEDIEPKNRDLLKFNCHSLKIMKKWAFSGELSLYCIRSIAWKVFLELLPEDPSKWLELTQKSRDDYENLKVEFFITPGIQNSSLDPNLNNPLSQDEESPWNQYFEDSELKDQIRLDVKRTFPEVPFFQNSNIQDMMVAVLFCYARKFPDLSYIQGMHEILAPIVFVLSQDAMQWQKVADQPELSSITHLDKNLFNPKYMEHDSYALFELVMERLQCWYKQSDNAGKYAVAAKAFNDTPFARPQESGSPAEIVKCLNRIHDRLLKELEPEVHAALARLEISPQLYGIRWLRLLFGREFEFASLLTLWDAIFARAGPGFDLVPHVLVAMIVVLKKQLLESDYVSALNSLMRYCCPCDVRHIICLALHFLEPKSYRLPRSAEHAHSSEAAALNSLPPRVPWQSNSMSGGLITGVESSGYHSLPYDSFGTSDGNGPARGAVSTSTPGRARASPSVKITSGIGKIGARLSSGLNSYPSGTVEFVKDRPLRELRSSGGAKSSDSTRASNRSEEPRSLDPLTRPPPSSSTSNGVLKPLNETVHQDFLMAQVENASVSVASAAAKLSGAHRALTESLARIPLRPDPHLDDAVEQVSEVAEMLRALSEVLQTSPSW